jgi:hypothetical protein
LFAPIIDVAILTEHTKNTEIVYQLFRDVQMSILDLKELCHPPLNNYDEKYQEIAWLLRLNIMPIFCVVQKLVYYFQTERMTFQSEDSVLSSPDNNRIGASFLGLTDEWKRQNNNYPDFPDSFKKIIRKGFDLDNVDSIFPDPF